MICSCCQLEKNRVGYRRPDVEGKVCGSCYSKWRRVNVPGVREAEKNARRQPQILEKKRVYDIEYRDKHSEKIKASKVRLAIERPELEVGHRARRKARNPSYMNQYFKARRSKDPNFRLAGNLRARLRQAIMGNQKYGSAIEDLGCTIDELWAHLESKFYPNTETGEPMTRENYGRYGWHIDHIHPLLGPNGFDLTDRQELLRACHYTNLQPLWRKDNLSKQDKLDWAPAAPGLGVL